MPGSKGLSVAFVGLGAMGVPMAQRLVDAGLAVKGFDVATGARERAGSRGVPCVSTFGDAVAGADVVVTILPDSDAVESVLNDAAVLDLLSPTALVVDMSSSEPMRTRALAGRLGEHGVRLIDAPVSGGVAGAESGRLTVMVGGSPGDVDEARPVLEALGRVVHVGPTGSGHAVKALNNLLSATHLLSACEALMIGQRFGLDPQVMLNVFNGSSGRSGSTENKLPNFILPETFNSGFGLRLMVKDLRIAVELASRVDVDCELSTEALELWTEAALDLAPTADHTEIARWLVDRERGRVG